MMAAIRKHPFGYQMVYGEIALQQTEAATTLWVYQTYADGASFNGLLDTLREGDVHYDGIRPWNKNMVARILKNRKYLGEDGYPQIIPEELFEKVQKRLREQAASNRKTPAQKELRRLCGSPPPAYVEDAVRRVLNRLILCPEEVVCEKEMRGGRTEIRDLRRELETLLQDPPVDEGRAKELTFEIAAIQLDAIGPEEYETERLQRLFQRRQPMAELDAELLHESVRKITYSGDKTTVLLKNNQSFEGGRTNERK